MACLCIIICDGNNRAGDRKEFFYQAIFIKFNFTFYCRITNHF